MTAIPTSVKIVTYNFEEAGMAKESSNEKLLTTGVGVFSIIGEAACLLLVSKDTITRDDLLSILREQLEHIPNVPLDLERMAIEAAITRLQRY